MPHHHHEAVTSLAQHRKAQAEQRYRLWLDREISRASYMQAGTLQELDAMLEPPRHRPGGP